jgi:hypothetical protein
MEKAVRSENKSEAPVSVRKLVHTEEMMETRERMMTLRRIGRQRAAAPRSALGLALLAARAAGQAALNITAYVINANSIPRRTPSPQGDSHLNAPENVEMVASVSIPLKVTKITDDAASSYG